VHLSKGETGFKNCLLLDVINVYHYTKAVALVLPQLKGKLNGIALRVPTPNVSVVDMVIQTEKKVTAEEVNDAFRKAAAGPMKGILQVGLCTVSCILVTSVRFPLASLSFPFTR
jgi:glyceraldehyde-3-phosphate dehydrogenase/erythrose-4-phosphate dehydrogenase